MQESDSMRCVYLLSIFSTFFLNSIYAETTTKPILPKKLPVSKKTLPVSGKKLSVKKTNEPAPTLQKKEEEKQPTPSQASQNTVKKKKILIDARRLTDEKFTATVRYMKENPDLHFKLHNTTIDPTFLIPLLKNLKEAQALDQIKDIEFVMLASPNAQVLKEADFIQKILPFLIHIESLELGCLGVTNSVVKNISLKIPQLKTLSLFGPGITDNTIQELVKDLPNLTKIHLINTHLTSKGKTALINGLQSLNALGLSGPNLKDADFATLGQETPTLHSLSVMGQTFQDMKTLKTLLTEMPKLHTLDLSETNVTDEIASFIAQEVQSIRNLNISETKITKKGIKEINDHLDLTTFSLDHLKSIGDDELRLIASKQPNLRKFHFAGASFTDGGLMHVILMMPKLTNVTLIPAINSKWVLSEAIVEALTLKSESKLQYLYIRADNLPEAMRIKLDKAIPNLRIEYQ